MLKGIVHECDACHYTCTNRSYRESIDKAAHYQVSVEGGGGSPGISHPKTNLPSL